MKTSIIARIFTGAFIVICIIRFIIMGINTLINGFPKDDIIGNMFRAIGVGIATVIFLILLAGIILTVVRFTINVFIWTVTGNWNKNWFFDFD